MRLVLDTDVVVAALRSPQGASAALLEMALDGHCVLLANVPLAVEYEAVLMRAEHRLAAGLTASEMTVFVHGLVSLLRPVASHFVWRPQLRDAADEMVLEAAINGGADALVSFNHRHFHHAAARFGLPLLLPRDVLRHLRKESSHG